MHSLLNRGVVELDPNYIPFAWVEPQTREKPSQFFENKMKFTGWMAVQNNRREPGGVNVDRALQKAKNLADQSEHIQIAIPGDQFKVSEQLVQSQSLSRQAGDLSARAEEVSYLAQIKGIENTLQNTELSPFQRETEERNLQLLKRGHEGLAKRTPLNQADAKRLDLLKTYVSSGEKTKRV